jgi:hypothetical protein
MKWDEGDERDRVKATHVSFNNHPLYPVHPSQKFRKRRLAMSTNVETDVAVNGQNGKVVDSLLPSNSNNCEAADGDASTRYTGGHMQRAPITKYQAFAPIPLKDRTWPDKQITSAPIWCSVDLRDGNQALGDSNERRRKVGDVRSCWCKSASRKSKSVSHPLRRSKFDFIRRLIDENRIPDDVTVQVLVQAREELIRRTFESLRGARRAIVHMYNSTNPAQRRIVFGLSKEEIKAIAVRGASLIRELADADPTPMGDGVLAGKLCLTELEYSLEVCEAWPKCGRLRRKSPSS